ncbi:MAG: beta-glucosidase BglX [Bacteroidales bacterium]
MKTKLLITLALLAFVSCTKEEKSSIDTKVDELLSKMTIEEKVGQLNQYTGNWQATGPVVRDTTKYTQIKNGKVGAMLNIKGVDRVRTLQEYAMQSRLKIPLVFGLDVVHGFRTIFPIPLAEAASFDLDAIELGARVAAIEASASGVNWTFAPMVDVSRDARWGRVMEGAGEDPWYNSKVAIARVNGFQGDDLSKTNTVAACAKHFAAYGEPIAGKDYGTVDMSISNLYNIYLPPFKATVDANVSTFMNAFNDLNGVPCSANESLLRDILKGDWDFQGFVVSDWGSIQEMRAHGYVEDMEDAAYKALKAGTDMDMEARAYVNFIPKLIEEGKIEESVLDDAVRRVLRKKFELGLFDDPFKYCDEENEKKNVMSEYSRASARDVAKKSIVLLKNENNTLPLSQNCKKVALVGPLMDSKVDMPGFWANEQWTDSVITVLDGIKKNHQDVELSFTEGYDLETNELKDLNTTIANVKDADVIIVAVGERWDDSGEAKSSGLIEVKESQQRLVEELSKLNKPVVTLVMGGRPLIFNKIREASTSILFTWWLGTEAGNAITDVLWGDYNPAAKLPMTFPKYVGQCPIFYNYHNTGRPSNPDILYSSRYKDIDYRPAYPFGYGLSYTEFELSNISVDRDSVPVGDKIKVSIDLANKGNYDGEEVVQLYIRDMVASLTRPVKELKGFEKIFTKKGESRKVEFELDTNELGFWDNKGIYKTEPGKFKIMIGSNSRDVQSLDIVLY